jgi:hypothetical protein
MFIKVYMDQWVFSKEDIEEIHEDLNDVVDATIFLWWWYSLIPRIN